MALSFASVRNSIAAGITATADAASKKADQLDVKARAKQIVRTVDNGAYGVNRGFTNFLIEHPGLCMTLAPGTVIKVVAAHHADQIINERTAAEGVIPIDGRAYRAATVYGNDSAAN